MLISDIGVDPVWNAIRKIPTVITIDFGVWLFFSKWAWKWKIFQGWLVPFPVLEGTWSGVMKSTWIDPATGKTATPIPFTLVIKQSFLSVSCAIYTKESSSTSYSSEILVDKETKRKQFIYHYANRPQASVRDHSEIHDGTAVLDIIGDKLLEMRGEYWTSRKTTGDIEIKFISKELREGFLES